MSVEVINRNQDLKRLQDEGYEIEVKTGCAIIHNVPYLDCNLNVQRGKLVSPLNMSGETVRCYDHIVYFKGEYPYRSNGEQLSAIVNSETNSTYAGEKYDFMLSNKPHNGYKDFYEKFTNYIRILINEVNAIYPEETAKTFKRVVSNENDIMVYTDTNASRAAISHLTDKFRGERIAIIGLGGTGSYILDQVAKMPVSEIHLYDSDIFSQHNAFRAPGAPSVEIFPKQLHKTEYFYKIYSNMHKGIVSHPYNINLENSSELLSMTYIFISMDSGETKKHILETLISKGIPFVDTGIDVQEVKESLLGSARITEYIVGREQLIADNISFAESEKGLYASNIQTSELNAFCALLAVMQWKRTRGFYLESIQRGNVIYDTNDGELK